MVLDFDIAFVIVMFPNPQLSSFSSTTMQKYCYDFEYIGLRFDPEFFGKLPDEVYPHIPSDANVHADHITCLHHSQIERDGAENVLINFIEDVVVRRNFMSEVKFTHIGISDKAIALKAELEVPCMNDIPHCTIATFNGGKPKDSNAITDWRPLDAPFTAYAEWYIKC